MKEITILIVGMLLGCLASLGYRLVWDKRES